MSASYKAKTMDNEVDDISNVIIEETQTITTANWTLGKLDIEIDRLQSEIDQRQTQINEFQTIRTIVETEAKKIKLKEKEEI